MKQFFRGLALAGVTSLAVAQTTPVGLWRAMGDDGTEPEALIRITERDGIFEGRITHVFARPGVPADARCDLCSGSRKGLPVKGLAILTGMRRSADQYSGGEILDPESGETYRCTMSLSADGRQLKLRGFIGVALFGRSQVWFRENTP